MRHLPSLNALVTFEAVARLGSFTLAARELRVTQGAVSRGVAGLEAWLGISLFRRNGKLVTLTEVGRAYREEVSAALDKMAVATARVVDGGAQAPLVLDVLPTLAMRWLIPRLPRFQSTRPGLEVRVVTSDRPLSPADPFDVAIRRGPQRRAGLVATRFMGERITPVCAPSLVRPKKLKTIADLEGHTLLHADTRSDAWPTWLLAQGAERLSPRGRLRFDHYYVALQAAQDGLGIAMGALPLVKSELEARRLIAPFPDRVVTAQSYYAVAHEGVRRPEVSLFLAWLHTMGEAEGHPASD